MSEIESSCRLRYAIHEGKEVVGNQTKLTWFPIQVLFCFTEPKIEGISVVDYQWNKKACQLTSTKFRNTTAFTIQSYEVIQWASYKYVHFNSESTSSTLNITYLPIADKEQRKALGLQAVQRCSRTVWKARLVILFKEVGCNYLIKCIEPLLSRVTVQYIEIWSNKTVDFYTN